MTVRSQLQRARFLVRSDFGRRCGWDIELDGEHVGVLDQPLFEDMFWCSYRVQPNSGDASVYDDRLWETTRFEFRSRATSELVEGAFVGGSPPFVQDGRVNMRRLYLVPHSRLERLFVNP